LLLVAPAMVLLGLGIHMLLNTLQTDATQMAPETRGLAVSTFANVLFMGQAAGVWLSGSSTGSASFRCSSRPASPCSPPARSSLLLGSRPAMA
jgi:predicted MFS family arabinose efflux permease